MSAGRDTLSAYAETFAQVVRTISAAMEGMMNEEQFNMELRKFLKRFGVSAQREIEKAVQEGLASGALSRSATLKVRARLEIEGVSDALVVEEELPLS